MSIAALDYSSKIGATQVLTSGARAVKSELGKNDFLQLLVTQIRHQDPLKPMEDREFVAQLAQFSALEQMMNVGLSSSLTYGMSVLSKKVYASDLSGKAISGIATSVRLADGKPMVKIQPEKGLAVEVELGRVTQVDVE